MTTCMVDLAGALEHMHGKGWLHLDIKAANVLITGDNKFKLGDFGTCHFLASEEETVLFKVGTSKYMSPELS